mmetsp:Transcript_12823/g.37790  ORF Transcript_12823/g.37790 Transcript_12823/m.37790 type:complete len:82 (+) Transcript_12823:69-314(+)
MAEVDKTDAPRPTELKKGRKKREDNKVDLWFKARLLRSHLKHLQHALPAIRESRTRPSTSATPHFMPRWRAGLFLGSSWLR